MSRFATFLAFDQFATVSAEDCLAAYREVAGPAPLPIEARGPATTPHGNGFMLMVAGGMPVAVLFMDEPLPMPAWASAAARNVTWREAKTVMGGTRAHVMITLAREAKGHREALAGATAVTLLAGALARRLPVAAMVYAEADSITRGDAITPMAERLAAGRELPVLTWTSLSFMRGAPTADGRPTVAALTTGLRPFCGREVEVAPLPSAPAEIARWLLQLNHHLIVTGGGLKDGGRITVDGQSVAVRALEQGQRPGVPVWLLRIVSGDGGTP